MVVLRSYADLSEAQIAAAMGISRGAVKPHAARAKDCLRATLDTCREPPSPRRRPDDDPALAAGLARTIGAGRQ